MRFFGEQTAEPRWMVLSGWMSDVWDPLEFHKEPIDAVAPNNPVFISRYTHGSGANSKALELAGITRDTPDPPGGHIKKDKNGKPTGEFVERAADTSLSSFAQTRLFQLLGVQAGYWPADASGYNYGSGDLYLKPRDMAKFGLLFLNSGMFDGSPVIPSRFDGFIPRISSASDPALAKTGT